MDTNANTVASDQIPHSCQGGGVVGHYVRLISALAQLFRLPFGCGVCVCVCVCVCMHVHIKYVHTQCLSTSCTGIQATAGPM